MEIALIAIGVLSSIALGLVIRVIRSKTPPTKNDQFIEIA